MMKKTRTLLTMCGENRASEGTDDNDDANDDDEIMMMLIDNRSWKMGGGDEW